MKLEIEKRNRSGLSSDVYMIRTEEKKKKQHNHILYYIHNTV